jgi:ubiquinone biosynthesis protein COQ9
MRVDPNKEAKDYVLLAMLPHVVFDGWSKQSLVAGRRDLKKNILDINLLFPRGMKDVAIHFGDYLDRALADELTKTNLNDMPVRERILTCVSIRLKLLSPHKEAVRRLLSFLALPGNQPTGLRMTMKTVDNIWYAAGDAATDFNYYTKRGLLASIYVSTIIYWLSDTSHNQNETNAFLSQRINDVMQIPKLKGKVVKKIKALVSPLGFIKSKIS